MKPEIALIVGAGAGLSASLARLFASNGMRVALAARNIDKVGPLSVDTGAIAVTCDTTEPAQVDALFSEVAHKLGDPTVVVYNAGRRLRGSIETLSRLRAGC